MGHRLSWSPVGLAGRGVRRCAQRGKPWQIAALDQHQRRTPTSGDEIDPIRQAEMVERARAVATTDNGETLTPSNRFSDASGAAREALVLELANGAVPEDGSCLADRPGERLGGLRAD